MENNKVSDYYRKTKRINKAETTPKKKTPKKGGKKSADK